MMIRGTHKAGLVRELEKKQEELQSTHEQADMHASVAEGCDLHAANADSKAVIITSEDTDAMVRCHGHRLSNILQVC